MNILWIKVGGLWPPDAGGRLRSLHLISELSRRHRITLLTTRGPDDDIEGLRGRLERVEVIAVPWTIAKRGSVAFATALLRSWATRLPVDLWKFRVPALGAALRRRAAERADDLWIADFLSATPNLPGGDRPPVLHFSHNLEHVLWRRLADLERRPLRRLLLALEWRKMRRAEARACARADLTVAVSDADAAVLASLAPGARVASIPTGVDTGFFSPAGTPTPGSIVFTGSMDWHPNEDAVLHFLETILPRVRRQTPDATFVVVGRRPGERLRARARAAGARVTGTVPDVRPHLATAAVVVVPLRVGGGTRLKIFEALAMGKAVVSTTVGAEGLPLQHGVHYLRADTPEDFARAVTALLRDPARAATLGAAGRRLVLERHDWTQVAGVFDARCRAALEAVGEAPRPGRAPDLLRRLLPGTVVRHARALRDLRGGRLRYAGLLLRRLPGWGRPAAPGGAGDAPGPARVVLYVCRGNVIRSPMAEALLRQAMAERGDTGVMVRSAGLCARRGQPADPRALEAALRMGLSLEGHRALRVSPQLMAEADLIVPMDAFVEADLRGRYPEARDRIRPLPDPRPGRRPRPIEIHDPCDGDLEDVRRCYALLRACVRRQAEGLLRRPAAGAACAPTPQEDRPCA